MEDHLLELLQGNDAPAEATLLEVKNLLIRPLKEQEVVELEIQQLEALLEEKRAILGKIQSTISTYNIILAPIRRIPTDILREIFYQCLPMHRNSVMAASEAPVLLTRICSGWRSIALSSPRIWTRLHISIPATVVQEQFFHGHHRRSHPLHTPEVRANLAQTRSRAAQEWLSRSGTCPLSISISLPDITYPFDDDNRDVYVEQMIEAIVPYANRWRDVELKMPWKIYKHLEGKLSAEILSSIQSFKEDLRHVVSPTLVNGHSDGIDDIPTLFLRSPNLTELSSASNSRISSSWTRSVNGVHFSRLTSLSLDAFVYDVDIRELLLQCRNLIDCTLRAGSPWNDLNNVNTIVPSHRNYEAINLPHLLSFCVMGTGRTSVMEALFASLIVPSLTHIKYGCIFHSFLPASGYHHKSSLPLNALLENTAVSEIEIQCIENMSRPDIENIFQMLSSVKHLVLGIARTLPPVSLTAYDDFWDFNHLQVKISSSGQAATPPLLPDLEILEIYEISSFTDQNLLDLITSRIDGWRHGRTVAPLKRVKIWFVRVKQLDIVDQAIQYAKAAGVDLKLELRYTSRAERHLDPTSPFYGMTSDDRTWDHPSM